MESHKKTAILLFAESTKIQAEKKHLLQDRNQNFALVQHFRDQSLKEIKKSGLDYFHFDETAQYGCSFAQKLAAATESVFLKGYDRIIVVGSDSPDLSTKDLWNAQKLLETRDIVLGPDLRGGVYLIALNKKSFIKGSFQELLWQSKALRRSFREYARSFSFSVSWLRAKADFNASSELVTYWNLSSSVRKLLNQISGLLQYVDRRREHDFAFLPVTSHSRRGPPVY